MSETREQGMCRNGAMHYCPNCDNSFRAATDHPAPAAPGEGTRPTCEACQGKGWVSPDDTGRIETADRALHENGYEMGKARAVSGWGTMQAWVSRVTKSGEPELSVIGAGSADEGTEALLRLGHDWRTRAAYLSMPLRGIYQRCADELEAALRRRQEGDGVK